MCLLALKVAGSQEPRNVAASSSWKRRNLDSPLEPLERVTALPTPWDPNGPHLSYQMLCSGMGLNFPCPSLTCTLHPCLKK